MHLEARAKINWALNITGRRENGYHELDMLMQSIALSDALDIEPSDRLELIVDGTTPEDAGRNLVTRAAMALKEYAGVNLGARLSLQKRVPARAGLGGGSADCAAALRGLNALWGLGLDDTQLALIGVKLGADVPFCLCGGLARVSGIGENIEPIPGAPEIPLVLVTPGGGLSTADVFRAWDAGYPPVELDTRTLAEAVTRRDLPAVDRLNANALTAPAVALMPEIGEAMDRMRALGAEAVLMTGSGSTVVGAFRSDDAARAAAGRIPGAIVTRTLG